MASLNLSWSMWNLPCVTRGLVGCTRTLVVAYRLQSTWVEVLGLSCPALCGILVLWPEIEHMSLALQGRFLPLDHQGSPSCVFFCLSNLWSFGAFFYQFLKWHISFNLEFLELIDAIVSAFFLLNPSSGVYKLWGPLTSGLFIIFMVKVKVAQSCLTLCNPMHCIVHGILQARILEWVAFTFSRRSS